MHNWRLCLIAFVLAAAGVRAAAAQEIGMAQRGPRFLYSGTPGAAPRPLDLRSTPVLRQQIALDLSNATLGEALAAITRQTQLTFAYSRDVVSPEQRVNLKASQITVAAALTQILLDADVDLMLSSSHKAALVRRKEVRVAQPGSIAGRVTDAKTGDPLTGAEVGLEGTKQRQTTSEKGFYELKPVEPGTYTLSVRRVGYGKQTQSVTVASGQDLTVNVALAPVVTQLDELVTTVTGEQRARELGHVVGRINADSVVREAPVSTLAELLTARVAGIQVFQNQGTVGGTVRVQSRGPNSFRLRSEPIFIVDGVRYTSAYERQSFKYPFGAGPADVEATSPINDLSPANIETIEVVKGPSAATLYGTDAANGVVIITTKRGRPGPAQWSAFGKMQSNGIPKQHFEETLYAWGHVVADGSQTRCILSNIASGYCMQDSITTVPNPLNNPEWTLLNDQPAWNYGTNVSGGSQQFKYLFAGDVSQAVGPLQMPPALEKMLLQQRGIGELPVAERRPNATHQLNIRANLTSDLGRNSSVGMNAGYSRGWTRSLAANYNPYMIVASSTPSTPYLPTTNSRAPSNVFQSTSTESTDRFFGGGNGQWRPTGWLQAHATVGIDLANRGRYSFSPPGVDPNAFGGGAVGDDRLRQLSLSGDVGATAMVRRGRVTLRTSVGAQYARTVNDQLRGFGYELPPGGTSVGEALVTATTQTYNETVTLGSFLEETVGLNDRLFLTGAVRLDGASAFGQNYDIATYPKVSLSWIVSEEPFMPRIPGLDELRLRFARGASGQQAKAAWAHVSYIGSRGQVDGAVNTAVSVSSLGNPDLKPERVREDEFGLDATALQNRVRLGVTWYNRRTTDAINNMSIGPAFGFIYSNLGLTTQHGFELELTATPVETRLLSLDVTVNHALHRTKLVDFGRAEALVPGNSPLGGLAEGYPIGGRFERLVTGYNDANGDNIIQGSEIVFAANPTYLGEGTPPISQTLITALGFFERRVRLSALFERKKGYVQIDGVGLGRCTSGRCRALIDPATPLMDQALAVAMYNNGYYIPQSGDFTRLRELSLALDVPPAFARRLRLRTATVSLAARNVALWSKFTGPDPESAATGGQTSADSGIFYSGGSAAGIPLARTWSLRVDLGL